MHTLISFLIYSLICWLFRSVLFSLHMFEFLTIFFPPQLRSNLTALWSEKMIGKISVFFLIFQDQIYGPGCDLFWRTFCVHLRKSWSWLFRCEMPYRYQFSSWSFVSFKVRVFLLIFCLVDLSVVVSGILKFPLYLLFIILLLLLCYY